MSEIRLNINGREVYGQSGQTVLQIARENGFDIPSLCHDERVQMYGSCGVCLVEAEGNPKLLRSCSTYASDGMIVKTDTERVMKARKTALELLLSDHTGDCRPPCLLACPAGTDCQGYVGLIANGEHTEALRLIKDKIPLPGSIGRVCPHPCEDACRRARVEEPIDIAHLKQFAADYAVKMGEVIAPEIAADSGKSVAVVGGGPGGLTAAWFLRLKGHHVTVYDAMPKMGGMLRYGIPEYRLPKAYLDGEIEGIRAAGINFRNNTRLGSDITLDSLRSQYDAVILATGAWSSSGLRCPGEELPGVVGGIYFLQDVALGKTPAIGRRVAVVGGGNTAMDACRTAVRLGAKEVYCIYRRTRNEMPAEEIEIIEAEEEGVIFKYLTNPIEVTGDSKVQSVRLQIMELGEPDASGRRAPVPVEGAEEILEVDTVIAAIGQKLNPEGLDGVELTRWNTIAADETSFRTNLEGVFAVGDATNNGADIAIAAIGEAKKAAAVVDRFLDGEEAAYTAPFVVKSEPDDDFFAAYDKQSRAKMAHRPAETRQSDFLEINHGFTEEQAIAEANRCLECGCHDYFECRLIDYANQYDVKPEKYDGKVHARKIEDDHPFIHRNPDKCILCGLCARVCEEVVGSTALGLVGRGFDTIVKPALDLPLNQTDCVSCGQCVAVCPTGALTETMMTKKQVPVAEQSILTTCSFCSVGCKQKLTHTGKQLIRSLPAADRPEEALLCVKGRFGFGEIAKQERLTTPLMRDAADNLTESGYERAVVHTAKKLQSIAALEGPNAVGIAISDRYTCEQALAVKNYADKVLGTENVFSFGERASGLTAVLGADASTADFDELTATNLVLLVNSDIREPHLVAGMKIRKAVKNGAKLVVLNGFDSPADELASLKANPGEDLALLKEILQVVLESGNKSIAGYDELAASLKGVEPSAVAKEVAEAYLAAKKAVIVFERDTLSKEAAALLGNIALAAGKAFGPRNGIIQLKPGANSQGLAALGVKGANEVDLASLKGLVIFGEDPAGIDLSHLNFLAVQDLHLTETAQKADVVFPGESFAETDGHFLSAVGQLGEVRAALPSLCEKDTLALVRELAATAGYSLPWKNSAELRESALRAMKQSPANSGKLVTVPDAAFSSSGSQANALAASFAVFTKQHHI